MSPIDIVPIDHQHSDDHYIDETIMCSGVIENRGVYSSEMSDIPSRDATLSIVKPTKLTAKAGRNVVNISLCTYSN